VDYETAVWVNGHLAGSHRGGYSPLAESNQTSQRPMVATIPARPGSGRPRG
jgi:hypothetical protein